MSHVELDAMYEPKMGYGDLLEIMYDENSPEEEIAIRIDKASKNLDPIFVIIPDSIVRKPHINFVLLQAGRNRNLVCPRGLAADVMARQGFVAKQNDQDMDSSRGIWFYGLDPEHSFSCYHRVTPFNLIAMAWVMANDFPPGVYSPETQRFILIFVRAWLSASDDRVSLKDRDFRAQERFLELWKEDDSFDLLRFSQNEERMAHKLVKKVANQSLPPELQKKIKLLPKWILAMCRHGNISDDQVKMYGPSIVLEMDPRRNIPWSSDMLQSLLTTVPEDLDHPKHIQKMQGKARGGYRPWIDMDIWHDIMVSGLQAVGQQFDDVCDMLGEQTLSG
ncbi:hypothetical protein P3342_002333 [Pyrenophora teres f. teres]|uniref:Uncharacterized protein n=1 Tax=Pyrenophora teres f. teres (strain 0-1) TaxID=861557 RepID=E3RVD7_PYRTT|nr:hypothetical protein PTT_13128 [Pyrenophora teres f. teres 0-1]KAE8838456.1 hypothetical protein HRS9139_02839 [Pyrenophora teres f. teres]KAE8844421.1 hypothetical protein PTNB85_02686 [Pyrenophora teres f. teres]KAE8847382.1 hypothetical protein HRS9122_04289 [Pyrenophora teres f. teres]KAE8872069.1 hypothetical protein PTNB73_03528 [Pyrenophora teres f. teres]